MIEKDTNYRLKKYFHYALITIVLCFACQSLTLAQTTWSTKTVDVPARVGCQTGSYDITLQKSSSGSGWYSSAAGVTVSITFNSSGTVNATTCTGLTHNGTAVAAGSLTLTATTISYAAPVAVAEGTTFHIILNGITHGSSVAAGNITVSIPCNTFGPLTGTTNNYTTSAATAPTTSAAGSDQAVCGTTATLAGNTPTTGTGTWTLVSGSGTITTPSSPTSGITGLAAGANTFRWTIATCAASSTDDVIITEGGTATVSTSCVTTGNTVALTLSNYPGTLQWQQSLNGGAYTNITGATTTPYTTAGLSSINTYTFRAHVTSGACTDNSTTVMVDCGDACAGSCARCTWCNTSSTSGCTWTVSANSATAYTVNGSTSDKLCIIGGTYTGAITLQGGTVVVSGGTFNPSSITLGIMDVYGGTIEIQSGVTSSTLPAISYNGSTAFSLNNCCSNVTLGGDISINGSGAANINNNGTMSGPTKNISFNGSGTFCNGSYSTVSINNFSANGTAGSSINNQGTFTCAGTFTQNSTCPINLCRNSLITVAGSFLSNGGLITGVYSCGAIKANSTSTCTGCTAAGTFDFCDETAFAAGTHFDSETGAVIGASVTSCTCSALPIELLWFTGIPQEQNVLLKWSTATEINNDYFTLERSTDAINFDEIGKVKGAGNSNHTLNYNFVDNNPLKGLGYYRLKQTDYDGKFVESKIITIESNPVNITPLKLLYAAPDQSNNKLQYQFIYNESKPLLIQVVDVVGNVIYSYKTSTENSGQPLSIDTSTLNKGVYLLKISDGMYSEMKKFVY